MCSLGSGVTIPIDVLLSIVFGSAIALSSRGQLRVSSRTWFTTRYFVATVAFHGLVVLPSAAYRYFFHPDWSYMYLVDTSFAPVALSITGLIVLLAAGVGAFLIGSYCVRSNREWLILTVIVTAVAGIALVATLGVSRLGVVGTTAQQLGSYGLLQLHETDLLPAMLVMGGCVLGGWIYILVLFSREGTTSR